jgi:hypothetical protein
MLVHDALSGGGCQIATRRCHPLYRPMCEIGDLARRRQSVQTDVGAALIQIQPT